jgi:uncharacterized protein
LRASRPFRRVLLGFILYAVFCVVGGIFVADATLHPARRPITDDEVAAMRNTAAKHAAEFEDVAITMPGGVTLSAWKLRPRNANGDAVILLHGLGDNRVGMVGYAQLFLAHGYIVLMPDARAHGISGGELATYGVLERNDIRAWSDFLEADHPRCIFGFGESMGAAQLLQSLSAGSNFCAVVAESPFADFREIAYDRMGQPFHLGPWVGRTLLRPLVEVAFLRARWKYRLDMQKISPEDSVATATVPVLLIHSQIDSNIPVRHSRLIHAGNPKTQLWEVSGADHCGAISEAPQEFERRVLEWFEKGAVKIGPGGTGENSPAFQPGNGEMSKVRPVATRDLRKALSVVPTARAMVHGRHPPVNWRVIVSGPCGTRVRCSTNAGDESVRPHSHGFL